MSGDPHVPVRGSNRLHLDLRRRRLDLVLLLALTVGVDDRFFMDRAPRGERGGQEG